MKTLLFVSLLPSLLAQAVPSREIAQKVSPAVVLIRGVSVEGTESSGSGFIVDSSGTIVTNLHVIASLRSGGVKLASGDLFDEFRVRAIDRRRDIGVIQIPGYGLPTVTLGDSDDVAQGDHVSLIGNPFELEGSFTTGVVSAVRALEEGFRVIQTDAAANPGNSGGPLLDEEGRAIGVVTFKATGSENINFVVPINYVRGLLTSNKDLTLAQLRAELAGSEDPFKTAPTYPARWKSLQSASPRTLRVDGDYVYIEIVLPEDQQRAGAFMRGQLKKTGDRYRGRVKHRIQCPYDAWDGTSRFNMCGGEWDVEITRLTPSRVEGTIVMPPDSSRTDCAKCKDSLPPVPQSFTWIPE